MSDSPGEKAKQLDIPPLVCAGNNPLSDLLVGFELSKTYKISRLIGTGGWGNVYLARHLTLETDVAVKVIHRHLLQNEASLRRLEQEARLLSQLENQNIVRIMDYGIEPFPFIVMEYFDGIPLSTWLKDRGPLEYGFAIELFMQICDGLSNANQLGLVHRDLKPGNVLLKIEENRLRSKIVDFGLAKSIDESEFQEKLTATGEVLGSPPYMSPEQWTGHADHRSDLYSFGCIMYEVLTGKTAFAAKHGMDYLNEHVNNYPPAMKKVKAAARFPAVLEEVVRKCIQKSPEDRYQTSAALKADLENVKAGRKIQIRLPVRKKLPGKKTMLIAALAVLLVGVASAGYEPALTALCRGLNAKADKDSAEGKTDEAISGYRQTIMLAKLLGRQDRRKLHAMRRLSSILKERKQLQESDSLEREVNDLTGWPGAQEMEKTVDRITLECNEKGDLAAAEAYTRKSLEKASARYGEHSLAAAELTSELAGILRRRNLQDAALKYNLQAVKVAEELLEPDDPRLPSRLNYLGLSFAAMKQYDDSERVYRQAISILEKAGKVGNDCTLSYLYNNLGSVYSERKRYAKALESFQKAVALSYEGEGCGRESFLSNVAWVYSQTNELDRAVEYYKKSLDYRRVKKTDRWAEAELTWLLLGQTYFQLKDFSNAEKCLEQSLQIIETTDSRNPDYVSILRLLIDTKQKLGKVAEVNELQARLSRHLGIPLPPTGTQTHAKTSNSK
jgi:tetratricopeptide (TPR) repeat protein